MIVYANYFKVCLTLAGIMKKINKLNKTKALFRNASEQFGSAQRNFNANAFNVTLENSHMSIELTLKSVLLAELLFFDDDHKNFKTHYLDKILQLQDSYLKNVILNCSRIEKARKLHDIISEISSSAYPPWWEPEQRYYGSCDSQRSKDILEKAEVIYKWVKERIERA